MANGAGPSLSLNPVTALYKAVELVPQLKYAVGVIGLAGAVAIGLGFISNLKIAVFGIIITIGLMYLLVIFTQSIGVIPGLVWLAAFIAWAIALLFIIVLILLLSSYAFGVPKTLSDRLFATSVTISGRVAYEPKSQSDKGLKPVEGAEVEIKGTGLKSKTDGAGNFTISNIPTQFTIEKLIISRGGQPYTLDVKKKSDEIYRIPEEDIDPIKSIIYTLSADEWNENKDNRCPQVERNKYSSLKQFSLRKTVHKGDGFSDLIIRIWSQEGTEIVSARKLEPQEGYKVQDMAGYSRAQKWSIPINRDETTISLSVCLGGAKGVSLSRSSLQASYWFEKVE